MSLRRRAARDEGTSLIELMVGMTLMLIFMGMFTAAVILMNRSANKVESVSLTSTQVNTAFLKLDRMVRYAAAISTPGNTSLSGDWYVELRTTNTGSEVCTQLRFDIPSSQLQKRSWRVSGGTAVGLSGWTQMAGNITNGSATAGSADQPFVLTAPGSKTDHQRLAINMVSYYGSATTARSRSAISFTALNSSPPVPATICQEVGRP
jgi:Tfp pilus assembly protein PilW